MSDTLLGVLVGGVLASITPLVTLFINHAHWKREMKLNHLKAERLRLEQLFERTLAQLADAMESDTYSSNLLSDMAILMPEKVIRSFEDFMRQKNSTEEECKESYLNIAVAMKAALSVIDKKIDLLLS